MLASELHDDEMRGKRSEPDDAEPEIARQTLDSLSISGEGKSSYLENVSLSVHLSAVDLVEESHEDKAAMDC